MAVRDAQPDDVEAIAGMTRVSRDAASRLIQERSVLVVDDDDALVAFVSFDATEHTVQLTHLAGKPGACRDLLDEAIGFADRAGMPIEMVIPDDEQSTRDALEAAGFDVHGNGPRFEGTATTRYRREPDG